MRAFLRHRQKMKAHDIARRIVKDEVDVVERDDARQPLSEIAEQVVQIAVRRNRFGDLEQQSQLIALSGQLELCGALRLIVQHVVDGDRDWRGHVPEKFDLRFVERVRRELPNPIAPSRRKVVVSGSMQNEAIPIVCISEWAVGNRSASSGRRDDDWLLGREHAPAERPVDRESPCPAECCRYRRCRACECASHSGRHRAETAR